MATRTNAQEEKIETLRSIMNVIALLDQGVPRSSPHREFSLRSLLPVSSDESGETDDWDGFLDVTARAASDS